MTLGKNANIKLENFDEAWSLGDPSMIEKKFQELLPQAQQLKDKSIYLQILSQMALAQSLQKKFDEAHQNLDKAESLLTSEYELARVRILLERGRVFQQAESIPHARDYFEQSFELSKQHGFDTHTINAAHMIAIVVKNPQEKIRWNQLAIHLATSTKDKRTADWLGSLYHNLGQNYLEEKQFDLALQAFQSALAYRQKEGYVPNIRVAKWAVANALRLLDRSDEALSMLLALIKEYDVIVKTGNFDMPQEMFILARGLVYEEIAKNYQAKTIAFAQLAYGDLSGNAMFSKEEPKRLDILEQMIKAT